MSGRGKQRCVTENTLLAAENALITLALRFRDGPFRRAGSFLDVIECVDESIALVRSERHYVFGNENDV